MSQRVCHSSPSSSVTRWFQFLAIYYNETLPNIIFCQILNKTFEKLPKTFEILAKMAIFRQI